MNRSLQNIVLTPSAWLRHSYGKIIYPIDFKRLLQRQLAQSKDDGISVNFPHSIVGHILNHHHHHVSRGALSRILKFLRSPATSTLIILQVYCMSIPFHHRCMVCVLVLLLPPKEYLRGVGHRLAFFFVQMMIGGLDCIIMSVPYIPEVILTIGVEIGLSKRFV